MSETEFDTALTQLEVAANNFAIRVIRTAQVREAYVTQIAEMSRSMREAVNAGQVSPRRGAQLANELRNQIMDMQRARDFDLGRAIATKMKKEGLTLTEAIEKAMKKLGLQGQKFNDLTGPQQRAVYNEVIEAAGRSRPAVTRGIPKMRWAARGLWFATFTIAAYNIGTAEDPWWQSGRETANIAGGLGASFAAGAAMGAAGGVWAGPVGIAVGIVVGGVLGALLADRAYVEIAGVQNSRVRPFIDRFTGFFTGVDVKGMAEALETRHSTKPDFINEVLRAMDADYWMSADNVALALVRRARRSPALSSAIAAFPPLRETMIELLDGGWTSGEERSAMRFLKGF